jgi:hypothetical protein
MRTVSASNVREFHMSRARRVKKERTAARVHAPKWVLEPLLEVKITRKGPGTLDDDNLRSSLKAIRDGLADWLRVDDRSPLVRWEYGQERAREWSITVEVRPMLPGGTLPGDAARARASLEASIGKSSQTTSSPSSSINKALVRPNFSSARKY